MSAPLYNRDILALAIATADYLPNPDARYRASKRAPLCGSAIILDLDTDESGRLPRARQHRRVVCGSRRATRLAGVRPPRPRA